MGKGLLGYKKMKQLKLKPRAYFKYKVLKDIKMIGFDILRFCAMILCI